MFAYSPVKAFPEPMLGVFSAHSGQQQRIDLLSCQNEAAKPRQIKGQVGGGVLTAWAVKCFIIVCKIPEAITPSLTNTITSTQFKTGRGKCRGRNVLCFLDFQIRYQNNSKADRSTKDLSHRQHPRCP